MNVLGIVDQDQKRRAILVDDSSKLMINPLLMGNNAENGATLQELPEKSPIPGKKVEESIVGNRNKGNQKTKKFSKTTGIDGSEPLEQPEKVKPE